MLLGHHLNTVQQAIAVSLPQKMQAGIQEKKDRVLSSKNGFVKQWKYHRIEISHGFFSKTQLK